MRAGRPLLALAAAACTATTVEVASPLEVPGAIAFRAPSSYAATWYEVENCTGLRGDFRAVRWYRVPTAGKGIFRCHPNHCHGRYFKHRHAIYIAEEYLGSRSLVAHESIHALGLIGHPPEVFTRCVRP